MKTFRYMLISTALLALFAAPALAYEPGTWVLRGGVGTAQPQGNLTFSDETGSFVIEVDDASSMTLTATYMFTENWAFDVLGAVPFEHDIKATMDLGTSPVSVNIAETKQLPATFSFQYHFAPDRTFQPYAGLGLNWTSFSSTRFVSIPDSELMDPELESIQLGGLKIDDSLGLAAQIGGDWAVTERMVVNFDVRWLDIDADLYYLDPEFSGQEKLGKLDVDPWLYSLNVGFYF